MHFHCAGYLFWGLTTLLRSDRTHTSLAKTASYSKYARALLAVEDLEPFGEVVHKVFHPYRGKFVLISSHESRSCFLTQMARNLSLIYHAHHNCPLL